MERENDTGIGLVVVGAAIAFVGVAIGAFILWSVMKRPTALAASAPLAPDIAPALEQIRQRIRTAEQAGSAGERLSHAAYALALLDALEAAYGPEEIARTCNPRKLRRLIVKLQDQYQDEAAAAPSGRPKLQLVS